VKTNTCVPGRTFVWSFLSCDCKAELLFVVFIFFLCKPFAGTAQQEDQVKLICYNLLNYPDPADSSADTTARNPYFRTTLAAANPDILVIEELTSAGGLTGFLSHVLNPTTTTYSAGTYVTGSDTHNGIFFKTAKFHFVSNTKIRTELRDINEFKLVHLLSGDTVRIYAVHLKASTGTVNEAQRGREVDSLRKVTNTLPAGSNFIVCGDFNFYKSSEAGYQKLLDSSATGYFIDPISMTGTWNIAAYSARHTQSTRKSATFGGGSTGGLDDRFDLILYSKAISLTGGMSYVSNSEIPYGNDGNHYNDSVMSQPNTAVSPAVATALYYSSDHLPVIANFKFQYGGSAPPDAGALSLTSPSSSICSTASQSFQVIVKNFGTNTIDFSVNNLLVTIQVTDPSSVTQTFNQTITSGTLAGNGTMPVMFNSSYNMSNPGTYTFNASASVAGDINTGNNSMPQTIVTVSPVPVATVSPAGPLSVCSNSPVTLTAGGGSIFLWSNGSTTQSISVSSAGNYSVSVSNAAGCSSTSAPVIVSSVSPLSGTIFLETMDSVHSSSPVSIAAYEIANGFDNDNYTMSGSGDVRNTTSSWTKYADASGGANVFLTNVAGRNFVISDINTSDKSGLQLSFGISKSSTAGTGSDLLVQVSSDGINYSTLAYPSLPAGSGTATWYYRTASGTIPSVSNLRIQFKQTDTLTQYRVDDVKLTYSGIAPTITANGPLSFCSGDSVTLTASSGTDYLWSTGATTQSIVVHNSGNYSVTVNCVMSLPVAVTVNNCSVSLDLKVFLEGFYLHSDSMVAVIDPVDHPATCDSITVQLVDSTDLNTIVTSSHGTISTHGFGTFAFNASSILSNHKYYIVILHRNAIETWSKYAVLFNAPTITFDFTRP
jgi:hypothetical protein